MDINWSTTEDDYELIRKITDRANGLLGDVGLGVMMDIIVCHCNGCPLKLEQLLAADDRNFLRDITDIGMHLDRITGKLTDHFLPRFADLESATL